MDKLRETLRQVLIGYTGQGLNDCSYLTVSDDQQIFAVVSLGWYRDTRIADAALIVRLQDDRVIIERDINDKILLDALLQAGVERQKIVLAYAGETLEETMKP